MLHGRKGHGAHARIARSVFAGEWQAPAPGLLRGGASHPWDTSAPLATAALGHLAPWQEPEMYLLSGGAPFRADAKRGVVHDSAGEEIFLLGETRRILSMVASDERWAETEVRCGFAGDLL